MSHLLYIDPGSGSYLVQVIVAAVLGVAFFFRNLRMMVTAFFSRLFGRRSKNQAD